MPMSDRSGVRQLILPKDLEVDISESRAGKIDSSSAVTCHDNIKINIKVTGRELNLE